MLERISVPRRALDFEDYIDIVRRNFRWILGPTFAGLVIATVVAFVMRDTYVSTAMVRIVPQQISDTLVQNATSQQIEDHINAMAESILSRNTLTNLVNTYHLYPKERESEPMEDVLNEMRAAIDIHGTAGFTDLGAGAGQRSVPAMRIAFKYRDRYLAQKVCEELVSRFLTQSTTEVSGQTEAANQFLMDEANRAKRGLDEAEQKLQDFRTRNAGRLPEEMQLNIEEMNTLSQQQAALNTALNRIDEQRTVLNSDLRSAQARLESIKNVTPQAQAKDEHVEELNKEIQNLQTSIEEMKNNFTDSYPDLVSAKQRLAVLEKTRDEAIKEKPKDVGAENPSVAKERLEAQANVNGIQARMKALDLEEQQTRHNLDQVSGQLHVYQARSQDLPAGQKEYMDLIDERNRRKEEFEVLDQKRQKSELATDLQARKQGETMEILDAASLPDTPTAPKRPMIIAMGPGIGLVLGFVIVGIREVRDTSLKNLKDARLYTQLNILGSVPLLENDLVVQRRKQIMWVAWAAGTVAGIAIMALTVAHYYLTKA